jgi:integrase
LFNRARYQFGSFRQKKRSKGPNVWEFRYYEMIDGVRKRQHMTLGTIVQFPTESAARKAAEARLLKLNSEAPTIAVPRFGAIIDRFMAEELPDRHSTRLSYCSNIENHIRPKWGDYPLDKVKPLPAEDWLKQLPLAPKTRSHIRSLMHLMFEAAQRWELIDKNPMSLVRVKGGSKRAAKPPIITSEQFYKLLEFVPVKYRLMVVIAQCLGLRVSEIMGLRWDDFDFNAGTLLVQRSVVHGRVDAVKTEYSQDLMPLDPSLASVVLEWKIQNPVTGDADWVFQNPVTRRPYHQEQIQKRYLKPAGTKAGLPFSLGWHTFRHTYRAWLDDTGAPMSVQQQLMRHASIQTTMNVYGQAMPETKRQANSKIVQMVLREPKKPTGTA